MPPIPVEAEAPPDLVTPLTASAAASASQARRSSSAVDGTLESSRSRSGKSRASNAGSASPTYLSSGGTPAVAHLDALRNAAHRDRVRGIGASASGGLDQALRQRAQR